MPIFPDVIVSALGVPQSGNFAPKLSVVSFLRTKFRHCTFGSYQSPPPGPPGKRVRSPPLAHVSQETSTYGSSLSVNIQAHIPSVNRTVFSIPSTATQIIEGRRGAADVARVIQRVSRAKCKVVVVAAGLEESRRVIGAAIDKNLMAGYHWILGDAGELAGLEVVGSELNLLEGGLPKEIALELLKRSDIFKLISLRFKRSVIFKLISLRFKQLVIFKLISLRFKGLVIFKLSSLRFKQLVIFKLISLRLSRSVRSCKLQFMQKRS